MRKLIAVLEAFSNTYKAFCLKWRVTEGCNYRCSYCLRNKYEDNRNTINNEKMLIETSKDISAMIDKMSAIEKVKIDIIGGEPSLYNLEKVFAGFIKNPKIMQINITTNLSRPADYYISLYDYVSAHNINLTMTASFHYEFTTINEYFNKMTEISSVIGADHINCEMVSNVDNQELVYQFRDRCKKNNLDYKIEKNLRYKISENLLIDSSMKDKVYYFKFGEKIEWSATPKDGYEVCNGRYLLLFDDGTYEVCPSRNNLYQYDDIEEIIKPNLINTAGFYCNNGINFMNIVGNKITNCFYSGQTIDIKDYEPIFDIEDTICPYGRRCSICGSISISKELNFLK